MGVSAIFVSALALHRLPEPRNPPQTQEDILAMALQPVVGFIVLVSIIVREYAFLDIIRGTFSFASLFFLCVNQRWSFYPAVELWECDSVTKGTNVWWF